jgi:hypothetical protein
LLREKGIVTTSEELDQGVQSGRGVRPT